MTRTQTSRDDVARRLRAMYSAKADQLAAFEAGRELETYRPRRGLDLFEPVVTRRRRSRPYVIGIAATVAVALVVALAIVTLGHDTGGRRDHGVAPATRRSGLAPLDAPLLAPGYVPDGLHLWSVRTQVDGSISADAVDQLFGSVGADGTLTRGVLVIVQPISPGGQVYPGWPTRIRVRGADAAVVPSKDAGEGDAPTTDLAWVEGNAAVTVRFRGVDAAQAAAVIDQLRPRGTTLVDGFDPASAPAGYGLLGEVDGPLRRAVTATFGYGRAPAAPGTAYDLVVQTTSASAYPGFLRGWINGARQPDGSSEYRDPTIGRVIAWPDGRQVVVSSASDDPTTARRIARSVKPVDAAGASSLAETVDTRLRALPLLQSTKIGSQRVELRGDGAAAALCLQSAADDHCASSSIDAASLQASNVLVGSFQDAAGWTVVLAASSPPYLYAQNQLRTAASPLPAGTAVLGSLHVALVPVPDGTDRVNVTTDTGNSLSFPVSLTRPTG